MALMERSEVGGEETNSPMRMPVSASRLEEVAGLLNSRVALRREEMLGMPYVWGELSLRDRRGERQGAGRRQETHLEEGKLDGGDKELWELELGHVLDDLLGLGGGHLGHGLARGVAVLAQHGIAALEAQGGAEQDVGGEEEGGQGEPRGCAAGERERRRARVAEEEGIGPVVGEVELDVHGAVRARSSR